MVASRIASAARRDPRFADTLPILKRQYYDVALSANPNTMASLVSFATPAQIVFGSDYPFASADAVNTAIGELAKLGLSGPDLRRIECDNALSLLPRLHQN